MNTIQNIFTAIALCSAAGACAAIHWLATEYNFGAFNEDIGPVTVEFRFINTGTDDVSILAARASCGCTRPVYPHGPVGPGDTATVSVTYDPAGRPGVFSKYVSVELSDPVARKSKLYVKGTVVGNEGSVARRFPIATDKGVNLARPAVMLGQVKKGSLRTSTLEAYNASRDSLHPTVTEAPDFITVDFAPAKPAPGEQFAMLFYFHSDRCQAYGMVTDSVTVDWGKGPHTIPVVAIVEEDFSGLTADDMEKAPAAHINPLLDFGTISSGALSGTVKVKNTGRSPLILRRVYTSDPGIEAVPESKEIKPGKSAAIRVSVAPQALAGKILNARVIIISNDPAHPTIPVRIVGEIK